jgi:hypothetical protein
MLVSSSGCVRDHNLAHWVAWWESSAESPSRRSAQSESLVYGNPSAVLTLVLLLACSAIAVVGTASRGRRILVGLVVALAIFAALVSGSRSGWLAIGLAALVTAAMLAADSERRGRARGLLAALASTRGRIGPTIIGARPLAPSSCWPRSHPAAHRQQRRPPVFVIAARQMFLERRSSGLDPRGSSADRLHHVSRDRLLPPPRPITSTPDRCRAWDRGLVLAVLVVSLALLVGLRDEDAVRRRWGGCRVRPPLLAARSLLDFYAT